MCAADWLTVRSVFHIVVVKGFLTVVANLFVFWQLTFRVPSIIIFVR